MLGLLIKYKLYLCFTNQDNKKNVHYKELLEREKTLVINV